MANNKFTSLALVCLLSGTTLPTNANTMLGAYINHDGWSLPDIAKFNTDAAKPLAIVSLFTTFDNHWDSLNIQASNIISQGGTPMITLMPYRVDNSNVLAAIASGAEDVYLNSWITSFRQWRDSYPSGARPVILLRFGHEFNSNWYPWGNQPETFKAAWQHMHALFEAAGVNSSVEWIWCANNADMDDVQDITRYYPGNAVVDWTAIDGYNWGSNYSFSRWKSFDETFSSAYTKLLSNYPNKPVMIAEVGSAEPGDLPNPSWGQDGNDTDANASKDAWVQDMYTRIMASYPAIRAVSWFNTNKELSWALNETALSGYPNSGLAGYNSVVTNTYFQSTFTPLKTVTDTSPGGKGKTSGGTKGRKTGSTTLSTASRKPATSSTGNSTVPGIQQALDVSQMPTMVGEALLAREVQGFRHLPAATLDNIRRARLNVAQ